jgi:hypothetical protein
MPARIPVQIAKHFFPSLNKARIFYTDILHRCDPGRKIDEFEQAQVRELMACAGLLPKTEDGAPTVRVVSGKYGRRCFATSSERPGTGAQVMSIVRAVKACVDTTTSLK